MSKESSKSNPNQFKIDYKPSIKKIHLTNTHVAGTSFIKNKEIFNSLKKNNQLILRREPDNDYDTRAILVLTQKGHKIGYIPRNENLIFSRLLNGGKILTASIKEINPKGNYYNITIRIYLIDFLFKKNASPSNLEQAIKAYSPNKKSKWKNNMKNRTTLHCPLYNDNQISIAFCLAITDVVDRNIVGESLPQEIRDIKNFSELCNNCPIHKQFRKNFKKTQKLKVKYVKKYKVALIKGKIYKVLSIENGYYQILSEFGVIYSFPPEWFEIV